MKIRNRSVAACPRLLALSDLSAAQNSPAATAASYLERGNAWFVRGEIESCVRDQLLQSRAHPARMRRRALAVADFDRVIEREPRRANAYCNRGLVKLRPDDEAGAERDFAQCLALDPELQDWLAKLIKDVRQQFARR